MMNPKTQLSRLATALLSGIAIGGVFCGVLRLLGCISDRDLSGFPLAVAVVLAVATAGGICTTLIAAMRLDWWTLRMGIVHGVGAGLFMPLADVPRGARCDAAAIVVSVTAWLLVPWAIGRFVYWASRPHD